MHTQTVFRSFRKYILHQKFNITLFQAGFRTHQKNVYVLILVQKRPLYSTVRPCVDFLENSVLEHNTADCDPALQGSRLQPRGSRQCLGGCGRNVGWAFHDQNRWVLKTGAAEHEPFSGGHGVSSMFKERCERWGEESVAQCQRIKTKEKTKFWHKERRITQFKLKGVFFR